jgi:hypothetical protein
MTTPGYDMNTIINRMKNLREFTVEVEIPEGKALRGVMPFDARISQNHGTFKVYALTLEEATEKVNEFLNQ